MAFTEEFNKKLVTFDGIDIVFDEKGARFLSMRRVQWVNQGEEPDRSKSKLEIRKYTIGNNGEEITGKGVPFLTEEGPHNLASELVKNGYGHTKDILLALKSREDFKDSVDHLFDEEKDTNNGEYFDMRSALLAEEYDKEESA